MCVVIQVFLVTQLGNPKVTSELTSGVLEHRIDGRFGMSGLLGDLSRREAGNLPDTNQTLFL